MLGEAQARLGQGGWLLFSGAAGDRFVKASKKECTVCMCMNEGGV